MRLSAAPYPTAGSLGRSESSPVRVLLLGGTEDGRAALIGRLGSDARANAHDPHAEHSPKPLDESAPRETLESGVASEHVQDFAVAWRQFAVGRHRVLVVPCPEQEYSVRHLAYGASRADAALLVADIRGDPIVRVRRDLYIVALLGVRRVALAIDSMDLVVHAEPRFRELGTAFRTLATGVGSADAIAIPVSTRSGANVARLAPETPWYRGPTLAAWLESVESERERLRRQPLRVLVGTVRRNSTGLPEIEGTVVAGSIARGGCICMPPAGAEVRVARIAGPDGELERAEFGQTVTLVIDDKRGIAPGALVCAPDAPAAVADQFDAAVLWLDRTPLLPGRTYLMCVGAARALATVAPLKYRLNPDSLEHGAAETLAANEFGVCELELDRPIAFDPYDQNPHTGGFRLLDRSTQEVVGVGMLRFALRRAYNLRRQRVDVNKAERARLKRQRPCVLWLTGLSGAGKSTVANLVEKRLHAAGYHTYLLDGDNVRHGLNKDLGFSAEDRVENIRRVAEVAKLMVDAGLIVITAFISPFRAERRMARELLEPGEFFEVHVDVPLEAAERRDPKGLYRKARRGELPNFTGIDSPYEPPDQPEVRLDTVALSPEEAAERVIAALRRAGIVENA